MKVLSGVVPVVITLASLVSAGEITHPELTPFDKSQLSKDSFYEDFQDLDAWKVSHATKDDEFTYVGKWELEESFVNPGFKNDKGLVLKTPAAHHAISAKLPTLFDNTNNTLVLQYEVKLQKGLNCGGAYIKLLSAEGYPSNEGGDEFNNATPYEVMFGPDKCGMTNKIHFIIRRRDPVTGEVEEKHLRSPPLARAVKTTTLYTLIIEPNNNFQIRVDGDVARTGNLLDEDQFLPPFNPPKEIEDPYDIKPEDWDDREEIPDPNETSKPEDWDESAPLRIPDPDAVKPEDWDENEENFIADPKASVPEDWDEEEDGEWIAPQIANPKCVDHGCGPWEPPLIPNPNYKGKWRQPYVTNPNYKGEWSPKLISNPDYFEDVTASSLEAIAGLGFELWTLQEDILFDNIYLGHSVEEAELIGNSTFIPKLEIEEQEQAASAPKPDFEPETPPSSFFDESSDKLSDAFDFVVRKFSLFLENGADFWDDVKAAPVDTLTSRPYEALYYLSICFYAVVISTAILVVLMVLITGGGSSAPITLLEPTNVTKKEEENDEDDEKIVEIEEDSKATGVEVTSEN